MIGPIVVSEIYYLWGTYVLFTTVTATLVISLFLTLVFWRQLVTPTPTVQAKSDADVSSKRIPRLLESLEETSKRIPRVLESLEETSSTCIN